MQNSLHSGSARTTHETLSLCPTSIRRAPSASARATSSAWSSGRTSKWSRFLICLVSGTRQNRMSGDTPSSGEPSGGSRTTSSGSSKVIRQPSRSAHHLASGPGSTQSTTDALPSQAHHNTLASSDVRESQPVCLPAPGRTVFPIRTAAVITPRADAQYGYPCAPKWVCVTLFGDVATEYGRR
jgi:hypothetical protein